MNRQLLKKTMLVSTLCVLVTGCGTAAYEEETNNPVLSAALPAADLSTGESLSANEPFQQQSFNDTNYVGTSDQQLGYLAQVPRTQTAFLNAHDDFAFTTSQSQSVRFALPDNSTDRAEATFCTDYKMQDSGDYRVNYNSCVLSAPVLGGVINEELHLVNQHDSVIGVVSFQDPSIQPIYQEFHFD